MPGSSSDKTHPGMSRSQHLQVIGHLGFRVPFQARKIVLRLGSALNSKQARADRNFSSAGCMGDIIAEPKLASLAELQFQNLLISRASSQHLTTMHLPSPRPPRDICFRHQALREPRQSPIVRVDPLLGLPSVGSNRRAAVARSSSAEFGHRAGNTRLGGGLE